MKKYKHWDLEKARECFEKRGCKLLDTEFKSYNAPMRYIATCGHEHTISLNNFVAGKGDLCRACRYKSNGEKERRLTVEMVREALAAECCTLISEEIHGWAYKFRYVAQCGHENETSFGKWADGGGRVCATCSKSIRYTPEYVRAMFEAAGCQLLEEYVNCKTPIKYRDMYGKVRHTTFDLFINGRNKRDRDSSLPPWRLFVFSRDDYTCQVCGERGGDLEAHHLESYADNKKARLDPENGVTLCKKCHREFHKTNGYGHNTKSQYEEWNREYRGKYERNDS